MIVLTVRLIGAAVKIQVKIMVAGVENIHIIIKCVASRTISGIYCAASLAHTFSPMIACIIGINTGSTAVKIADIFSVKHCAIGEFYTTVKCGFARLGVFGYTIAHNRCIFTAYRTILCFVRCCSIYIKLVCSVV